MLLIVAEAMVKEGCAEQFIKAAEPCIAGTRKEEGNISYDCMVDIFNPCKLVFVEQWENRESLDKHTRTEHFQAFVAATKTLMAARLVVKVYDAKKL